MNEVDHESQASARHHPLGSLVAVGGQERVLDSIELEPLDALTVQILMDNVTDSLLLDAGPVKRANFFNILDTNRDPS